MNIFEYQNHFQYELKPRQGGALVVSDGSLPQAISTFVTIKLSHEFIQRLKEQIRAFTEASKKEIEELETAKKEAAWIEFYKSYTINPDSPEVKAVLDKASPFHLDNFSKKTDKKEAWLRTILESANK